jgi:glycosyltransferase involved in cell wall biosynthesis
MNNSLSLCVICKNEEDSIGTLLESVKGDLFNEIIVVDTGSTDSTLDILKSYGVTIEHFEWINDFSAARNYSFSKANSDYVMWLDSDDHIKPKDYQKLLELKNKLHESPIWLLKYEYAHDEFGKSICSFFRERIVRRDLNMKWQQPIHEYMPLSDSFKQVDIEVHHNKKDLHTSRNVSILEKIVEENPNFARNIYYLGKEYFDSGEFDKGCDLLEKFLDMPDAWGENKYGALIRLSEYRMTNKENGEAREYLHRAIQVDPLKAKAYYHLGDIALGEGDFYTAVHWFTVCKNIKRSDKSLDIVEPKYHTWLPNLQLCIAYNSLGMIPEAAIANEDALKYRPEDSRMKTNKLIFVKSLGSNYPFPEGETVDNYLTQNQSVPEFKGKIGWYTTHEKSFASNRIRMQNVSETLTQMGYQSEVLSPLQVDANSEYFKEFDFIITGKYFNKDHLNLIKHWKKEGVSVICDINEDILQFPYVKETINECDYTVCCSQDLADKVSEECFSTNVSVIEDAVEYFRGVRDE